MNDQVKQNGASHRAAVESAGTKRGSNCISSDALSFDAPTWTSSCSFSALCSIPCNGKASISSGENFRRNILHVISSIEG